MLRLLENPGLGPGFKVFNLCANGRYVRPDGTICDLYADRVKAGAKVLNENGMSCGMVISYGKFRYFTAGDFSDGWKHADGPGWGRSPGEGNCYPLQYSCLESPMDRGVWQATFHGIARVRYD